MRLTCHRLGQQGLTGSGRAHQQGAFGKPGADFGIFSGIVQEIHHFHQGFLRLILSGNIFESNSRLLLYIDFGIALAHSQGTSRTSHLPEYHPQQNPHQHHRQNHIQQNVQDTP